MKAFRRQKAKIMLGWSARRLLGPTLVLFFLLLALPFIAILKRVYSQLEAQTYFQYRQQAEELTARIERRMTELLQPEELRPFADYQFFSVENAPLTQTQELGFSALSQLPVKSGIPGIIGYFQVNPGNRFTTPLLPDASGVEIERLAKEQGISTSDLQERLHVRDQLRGILTSKLALAPAIGASGPESERLDEKRRKYAAAVQSALGDKAGGSESQNEHEKTPALKFSGMPKDEASAADGKPASRPGKERIASNSADSNKQIQQATQLSELKLDTKYWEGQQQLQKGAMPADFAGSGPPLKTKLRQSRKELITVPSASEPDAESDIAKQQNQRVPLNQAATFLNQLNSYMASRGENEARAKSAAATTAATGTGATGTGAARTAATRNAATGAASQAAAPEPAALTGQAPAKKVEEEQITIQTFEGAIDPFQFELFQPVHFTFFRRVWRNNQRYIQGFVAESGTFLKELVRDQFYEDSLSYSADLIIGYKGEVQLTYPKQESTIYTRLSESSDSAPQGSNVLLYRSALPPPLEQMELLFTSGSIKSGPEVLVVHALAITFTLILLAGLYAIYTLGVRQLDLIQQRSDFVSAVSHELKTPLTSIRMYAEMLREGWVNDAQKQRSYYDFIFFEAERLSRLIANVLQLSRLAKTSSAVDLKDLEASRLLDLVRSKVDSQVQAAGFKVDFEIEGDGSRKNLVDEDSFVQIITNLVDNAIKFSAQADKKQITVGCRALPGQPTEYFVRDFGPGIENKQLKKIFELFYRGENEMTRTTPGTGIGLALVQALAEAMNAEVAVENRSPGAEFILKFRQSLG